MNSILHINKFYLIILIILVLMFSCSRKINTIIIERFEDGSKKISLKIINKGKKNAVVINKTVYDRKGVPKHILNRNFSGQLNGIQLDSVYYPLEKKFIELRTIYRNDSKVLESSVIGNINYKKSHRYSYAKPWNGIHLFFETDEIAGKEFKRIIFTTNYKDGKKHGIQRKFSSCINRSVCNDYYSKNIYWINDQVILNKKIFKDKLNNIIN